ncbi:hypothetical protein FHS16_003711 [Paenibacillus endophyticus]|uniref:SLH domain-containing protein n=1 Tax=Paenibacillus endophyticus TaxID=1294268 RepID=A0A7W5C9I1_9BACL|nr:S-layer homology domain-containing protein [Paenibacillus endophyticus]MBB3153636.1 hypothetical protein [Paenibacillus endophyticus]
MKDKLNGKWRVLSLIVGVCTVLFTVGIFNVSAASNIIKGPYLLFEGSNTAMSVLWQTSEDQSNVLKWGTEPTLTVTSSTYEATVGTYGDDNQHMFNITGLQPQTKYYYEVDGEAGSFVTAPADDATSVKFLSYGDSRTQPNYQDQVATLARQAYEADPAYQTLLLNSGDIASSDSESNWTAQHFVPKSAYPNLHTLLTEVPMVGARGNHEGVGSVYEKYYPYPYVEDFYWSFDYGPIHIAVVDEYTDFKPGSAQYNWLENDLASTKKSWKIVMGHQPAWGAGTHGNNTDLQEYIHPLLKQFGVPLYLNGHNHNYARAEFEGVEYITSGGGGAPSYDVDPTWPNIVKADKSYFLTEFDVEGDQMVVTSRRIDGTVIETITVNNAQVQLDISELTLTPDKDTLQMDSPDSSIKLGLSAMNSHNANVDLSGANVKYYTDKPDMLSIAADGTVTAKNKPVFNESAQVWAQIYDGSKLVTSNKVTIHLENPDGLAEATLTSDVNSVSSNSKAQLSLSLKDNLGVDMDLSSATIQYKTSIDDILKVSASGIVTMQNQPLRTMSVNIWAEVTVQGISIDSSKVSIIVGPPLNGESHVLVSPIKGQYDDTEELADGTLDLESSDLEIVTEESNQQILLRFAELAIPQGAKILDAYIQFSVDEPDKNVDPFDVNIYAEDVANSELQNPPNVSSRMKTKNFVNWKDAPAWTVEHEAGPDQQTPNVAILVQEIANKDGWKEGNTLGFILTGQGTRTAESFEGAGDNEDQIPQLHVIYTTAASVPTQPGNGDGNPTQPGNGNGNPTQPGNGNGNPTPPVNGGSEPVIPVNPFTDVNSQYDWANDAIAVLAKQGIINGTSATTFEPGKRITRADFMEMLVRMLDLKADVTSNFSDVSANDYYYKALNIVKALGIANGTGDNKFNPRDFISRQDMMVLISRAMEVTNKLDLSGMPADLNGFKDKLSIAPYAIDAAAEMVKAGIIQGNGSALNPKGQATRAETAQMIYRLYLMLQKNGSL